METIISAFIVGVIQFYVGYAFGKEQGRSEKELEDENI